MPRGDSTSIAFPDFKGATRWLVLVNLASFFGLMLYSFAFQGPAMLLMSRLMFFPSSFLDGALWQPLTYSFIHPPGMAVAALADLLSIWFIFGFLEGFHGSNWVICLYAVSVLSTAAAGLAIYAGSQTMGYTLLPLPLYGCSGGIFGLVVAIGVLYGGMRFTLFPLPFSLTARTFALIYFLVALALLYGEQRMIAFSNLGGALAGLLWARLGPKRGISFKLSFRLSEGWYGLRNRFYRWKRRNAARKFEVYMRSQGRSVHFDSKGRMIDEDSDDKKRWN
ncbi:MAG: rhomboid family intramembrane serine protease [Terracidiphilus sp.]|jgi:membrane associated rhomboid family serine protease